MKITNSNTFCTCFRYNARRTWWGWEWFLIDPSMGWSSAKAFTGDNCHHHQHKHHQHDHHPHDHRLQQHQLRACPVRPRTNPSHIWHRHGPGQSQLITNTNRIIQLKFTISKYVPLTLPWASPPCLHAIFVATLEDLEIRPNSEWMRPCARAWVTFPPRKPEWQCHQAGSTWRLEIHKKYI